jgi:hypothetical protein
MSYKWVKKWYVPSDSDNRCKYTVSISVDEVWGCSCPHWKFRKQECNHIQKVKKDIAWKTGDIGNFIELSALRVQKLKEKGKTDAQIDKDLNQTCQIKST